MSFSSWLRNGKRSAPAPRRRTLPAPRQRASFRPRLEALEDRLTPSTGYVQTNLASIQPGTARFTDPNLNGWGMTSMPNGSFVVANAFTNGTASVFTHSGQIRQSITVPVETAESAFLKANVNPNISTVHGHPTGVVYNPTNDFVISENGKSAPATLIFDTLDGTICGWNPAVDPTKAIVVRDTWAAGPPAVYTSLEIGQDSAGDNVLYATDFLNNKLEVINGSFQTITTTDCSGLGVSGDKYSSAWSVSNVNGKLYVTFADLLNPDPSQHADGAVDVFDADGNFVQQNDATSSSGHLQNPWGVTLAPANFGTYSNDLLVGNVAGAGNINVYKPDANGNYTIYAGQLAQPDGTPIAIKGLWDMEFDDGPHLFFDAGPNYPGDSTGGLFGEIKPTGNPGLGSQGHPSIICTSNMAPPTTPASATSSPNGMLAQQIDAIFQKFDAISSSLESNITATDPQLSAFLAMLNANLDALEATVHDRLDAW